MHCKVCEAKGAREEHLVDGRKIALCKICRQYLRGMLQTCENCAYIDDCAACFGLPYSEFSCEDWKPQRAGRKK